MTHSDLRNAVLIYLAPLGLTWSNNSGALRDHSGRLVRYGLPGSPDVLACIGGHFIGVECKVGRDRQSDRQQRFAAAMARAGGIYILARSVEDVADRLRREGLL